MSVRKEITDHSGHYFITFTCSHWLHLFEIVNGYDIVYKWFDYLKGKGHLITGYVIMPNHVHALIAFRNTAGESINKIIGNGKRFMAYEIVKRLETQADEELLNQLTSYVNDTDGKKGKQHEVFEPSFDWKPCTNRKFVEQKLNYIHENPCRGEWDLAVVAAKYKHSSAQYYSTGMQGVYEILSYSALEDIDLTEVYEHDK